MKFIDRTGQRYGRLTATPRYERRKACGATRIFWTCQCDCGAVVEVMGLALGNGNTRSCGCLKRDVITKHQMTDTKEYRAWAGMIQRCTNPNSKRWSDWGGRGIRVCERWINSFENFYADMGVRPSPSHSLDRYPDNDGNYEPGNVRWATRSEQQLNKRPTDASHLKGLAEKWRRENPEKAREVAQRTGAKLKGRISPNRKVTPEIANGIRVLHEEFPSMTLIEIGVKFGVGRETARKVIRRLIWC